MTVPAFLCLVAGLTLQGQRPATDTTSIYIAATTDVHGRATAWDYDRDRAAPLGLVRVATVIDSLRRAHPGRVVVVDAGDLLQGNMLAWAASTAPGRAKNPMVLALERIGYDAVATGNHEYNFPLPLLDSIQRGRRYTMLSANIVRLPSRRPAFPTDTVVRRGGVRIGITGATTPGVLVWDGPRVAGRLDFLPIASAVPPVVRRLRTRSDFTVLVAHSGLGGGPSSYGDAAPPENAVGAAIAAGGIDVAVLGHTHSEIADSMVGTTLVVQAKNWAQSVAVARVDLVREHGRWRVTGKHGTLVRLADVRPDSALVAALSDWHEFARNLANAPLGRSADAMPSTRGRLEDTPVVDFVNAVMRRQSGADVSAAAVFDLGGGIPAGGVSLRNVMSVYPYENTLKAVRISGADLRAYLEQATRHYRGMGPNGPIVNDSVPGYNFDMLSGVDYELDLSRSIGQRVTQLLWRGRDVRDGDSLVLALTNYRQQGGGGFPMVARAPVVYDRGENIRDLLADEIRTRGSIQAADYFVQNWRIRGVTAASGEPIRGGGPPAPARADSILLRVFATNDLHGALLARVAPWSNRRPVGGLAAIAGMMNRLAAECGCASIRLDGGDIMQGSATSNLTFGRAMVDAVGAMGISAAAIGNHEFDWTIDTLRARMRDARFAWLAANIRETATRARPSWVTPMTMVQAGPRRVAVVGFTATNTSTSTNPDNVRQLGFLGAAALDSAIATARQQRPDFVIVVAHEGAFCDSGGTCRGEIVDIAQALRNKPDLIVSGHTHSLVNTVVNGIPIVQARSSGTALGIVDLMASDTGRVARIRVETVWADRERPDSAVAAVVARYEAAVHPLTERVIATLATDLPRDGDQYALGDMIADALRETARADVAFINNTGIRTGLMAGPVTWGQLYEVLPFGNRVVKLTVTGAVLKQVLMRGAGSGDARASVSGLTVRIDRNAPPESRFSSLTLSDGRQVTDDATYTLATFDFLAAGGSGYSMLRNRPTTNTGVDELDAFIAWLQRQPQPIRAAQPHVPRITDRD